MWKFVRRQFDRLCRFIVDKILGVHDSPHRIALGVAIGIFITWTPTIGFQMALTVFLATILRANKVVGVPIVWLSNPATLWIYIPNYLLGCWLLQEDPSTDRLIASLAQAFGLNDNGIKERFFVLIQTLWDVLAPLMLGSVIIGAILGAICYVATYQGVLAYHRWRARTAPQAASVGELSEARVDAATNAVDADVPPSSAEVVGADETDAGINAVDATERAGTD